MFCPITPQKRAYASVVLEDCVLKQLSPFPHCALLSSTRKPSHLELLASPVPANRDLFSQLLATELKTPLPPHETLDGEAFLEEGELVDYGESQSEGDSLEEIDEESSESNGVKKRKRKSTAQIKILKQELQVQGNWSKEKIVEMSDVTGLSQSQVYKWWWDQKKKNARGDRDRDAFSRLAKRKLIHKDCERRIRDRQDEDGTCQSPQAFPATKVKANVDLDHFPETERKISKRLVFA